MRRRSTHGRSRSSSATRTCGASFPCGRRSRRPRIPTPIDAIVDASGGRRPDVGIPGYSGSGVTVALLDTGVDLVHPYVRGALLRGLDVLDPVGDASARQNPTAPGRPERHGTEMAGLVAGSDGPAGLQGVAPGVALLPIRVAGWQPDASGGVSVYGRTDQLLAGIELAVDPNEDGDAHDAARVTLVGVVEPFAAFADGPLAAAAAGATALDSLLIAPAGNDGPAGPAYGSIGGPGGAPAALTVGAIDTRRRSPTGHVLLLAGLRVLVSGVQPLGGAVEPGLSVTAPVVALTRSTQAIAGAAGGLTRLFDTSGYSRVGGAAVLLPRGTSSPEAVREAVAAGARAVLVDGPLPAGALGTDGPAEVPILGLSSGDADTVRAALRDAVPVVLAVGAAAFDENAERGEAAPFSSEGLSFDGGPKPEVSAAGVGLATSDPGRNEDGAARYGTLSGSSAAAALAAGAAALLAQARPDLDAAGLKQALVAAARRSGGASVGTVDPSAAAAVELVADAAVGRARRRAQRGHDGQAPHRAAQRQPAQARRLDRARHRGRGRHHRRDPPHGRPDPARRLAAGRRGGHAAAAAAGTLGPHRSAPRQDPRRLHAADPVDDPRPRSRARPDPGRAALEPSVRAVGRRAGGADRRCGARRRHGRAASAPAPAGARDRPLPRREAASAGSRRSRMSSPGATAFGITGRGPHGRRLPKGEYTLHLAATPVGGAAADERTVAFTVK